MFGRLAFLSDNSQTMDRWSVSEALATINDLVIAVEFLSISESFAMVNK